MDKSTELKEIEETLADLETRMACLRREIEEESKIKYKVGDILIVKGIYTYVVKVARVGEDFINGDYRVIRDDRTIGDLVEGGFFESSNYSVLGYFFE